MIYARCRTSTLGARNYLRKGGKVMKRSIAALLFALPLSALAQGYVGLGFGQTTADFPDCSISTTCDDKDTGFKIFGGYRFNQNFALEGGYADLGESTFSIPGFASGSAEATTILLHAVGMIPLNPQFSIFGKAGLHRWDAKESGLILGVPFSESDDGIDITFGAGVQANFGRFSLRLEWERYDVDSSDADFFGLSGILHF
jgi:OOP family OmpA-OmpF porin